MIYASYDHNMLTFEVFLSFSFVSFFYVFKNYTSITNYKKSFSLYTYIPIHDKLFLYTHALKTLSLYINMVYIKTLFLFKDFFFVFQHTLVAYTKISLYTLVAHTQEFLFTHYLYTQKIFPYIFLHIKNSFLFFIYRHDICSQRLFLFFYSWRYYDFCSFYF